ncbi:complex I subunit 4 family protein [Fimbriimonas ginsengisoli]|uniref:Putative NADH:ubiquinone oxidoreductase subunit M n=1 Tax=Fimbriimonas ginsengisoli Gsoil 348 TaxID=661478 RepID=A0A068NR78_FIMGI|nr:NADH-quinone oxidoreductase subunit M [Fimbriimonas ginsengisoli]AIE84074.1 putative NADH:ubiquinone oxidoreductase subunit M [Fimbriimonas ginsengisoli Gsoil 348]
MPILSILTFLPLLGALLLAFLPKENAKLAKLLALALTILTLVFGIIGLLPTFQSASSGFQFEEQHAWFPDLGVSYHLGVDGISMWLILLTALLSLVAVAFSWYVDKRPRSFMALILLLEGAMIGAFCSLDLVFFFTFFEATLIPMWLMILVWGGERRAYAANKFLIYTFAGSIFFLVGMIGLALHCKSTGHALTFDIVQIQSSVANGGLWRNALQAEAFLFWSFAAAFLVKSPIFPFHTWVPDTYGESPTAGPILSGAMVKLGSYGFLRFCLPLFPDAAKNSVSILAALAVIGVLYAAIVAAVQTDARRLLAYSSISHMGMVMLGIFSLNEVGMIGGSYQQLNHGIVSGLLFLLLGFLYQRRGTTMLRDFGGLKGQMPIFAAIFLIATLASLGLPGTNGFVGEILALFGIYTTGFAGLYGISLGYAIAAGASMVIVAVYMLYMFQQIFYGENANPTNRRLRDIKPWEIALSGSLAVLIIVGGLYSRLFTNQMEQSVRTTRDMVVLPEGHRPTWESATTGTGVAMKPAREDRG